LLHTIYESVHKSNVFFFQFKILKGMLENIRGLNGWHRKNYRVIYRLWRQRIMEQDKLDGDPKLITTIGLGSKSTSYWKINIK
jgi:hypothetical protein